jgi:hypothetical protein
MRNLKFKPFWLTAEETEWSGLWEKGVFKKWNRKDLLPNDRVFTSRYVYKIKRNAKTGAAYRFKARLIVRGFEMEKHVDYDDNFSPTPGIAMARIMVSLAAANDLELHSVDIEQAFTQADKLPNRYGMRGSRVLKTRQARQLRWARIRSKKLARSEQTCTCTWAPSELLLCTPATFGTRAFSGGRNARE